MTDHELLNEFDELMGGFRSTNDRYYWELNNDMLNPHSYSRKLHINNREKEYAIVNWFQGLDEEDQMAIVRLSKTVPSIHTYLSEYWSEEHQTYYVFML